MQTILAFLTHVGPLLLIMLKAGIVIGGTGSVLEEIGKFFRLPRLITFGQLLEHVGADVPGFVDKVRKLVGPVAPAVTMVLVFALSFSAGLACSGRSVAWPRVLSCAEPLEPALVAEVGKVLAGTGDVQTDLEAMVGKYAPGLIECAVQQIVSDIGEHPMAVPGDHRLARGRAFLAKVTQ